MAIGVGGCGHLGISRKLIAPFEASIIAVEKLVSAGAGLKGLRLLTVI